MRGETRNFQMGVGIWRSGSAEFAAALGHRADLPGEIHRTVELARCDVVVATGLGPINLRRAAGKLISFSRKGTVNSLRCYQLPRSWTGFQHLFDAHLLVKIRFWLA